MKSEVDALRKLNHPNLVNPLSVVMSAEQTLGFIVPYHEHGNLHEYLRKTTVNRMTKISLLHDVACGMRYIHGHKPLVIHGDLKIENVLVSVNRSSPIAKVWYQRSPNKLGTSQCCFSSAIVIFILFISHNHVTIGSLIPKQWPL